MGYRSGIAISSGIGCRCGLDPVLLWLLCRPAATAPIRPLAWAPPYAASATLKRQKKKKHPQMKVMVEWLIWCKVHDLYGPEKSHG